MNNLIPLRDFTAERIPADAIVARNIFSDLEAINPLVTRFSAPDPSIPMVNPDIEMANKKAKSVQAPLYDFSLAQNIRYQGGTPFTKSIPVRELEKEYATVKGGRWARKFSEMTDNFTSSFTDHFESTGHSINAAEDELMNMNFDEVLSSIANDNITDSAYRKAQRDRIREVTQPFYRYYEIGEAPIYSPEGMLGDIVPSIGYAAGSGAAMMSEVAGGLAIRALATTGVGAIALAALYGVGAPLLTNDYLRDKLGERNADIMLGYMTLAGGSALLGGISAGALKGGVKGIQEIGTATKLANKESANLYKAIVESADDVVMGADDILKGGNAASKQMGKAFDVLKGKAATLNKKVIGAQIGGHLLLGYLTSGGEAAMEATNAQLDYIDEQYNKIVRGENRIPTKEELAEIKEESKGVLESTNRWNRVILTISNAIGMRGILSSPITNNGIRNLPIAFRDDIVGDFTTKKALWKITKDWIADSGKEGIEEMSQFGISEGAKEYYEKELEERDFISTITDGALNAVSSEGLYEGLLGALVGGGMTALRTGKQVIFKSKDETWQKALFGYDNASVDAVAKNLNEQFKNLKAIFDVSNAKSLDAATSNSEIQRELQNKTFDLLYALYESGQGSKMGLILDNLVDSMSEDSIKKLYGNAIDPKTNKRVSQLEEGEAKAYFMGVVREYDKEAKQLATDIFNIGEYFADPFSLSTMEKLADSSFMTKLFKDKKKREQGFDITGTYAETAFKKKQLNQFAKDQVKVAARRMFMARRYKDAFDGTLKDLKQYVEENPNSELISKITINGKTQSLLDFITPNQYGNEEFMNMLDNRIKEIEAVQTLSDEIGTDTNVELGREQSEEEIRELEGLKGLKNKLSKYSGIEDMLYKEMVSFFELESLDKNLADQFRMYQDKLDRNIKEINDNAKIFETLNDIFITKTKNKRSLNSAKVRDYLNKILGGDYKDFTDADIRKKLEVLFAIEGNRDALLEAKRKQYDDQINEAKAKYESTGAFERKRDNPNVVASFQNNLIRSHKAIVGLDNIKKYKQSLVVTEQFESKKDDPEYKKQYLINMFEIYDKHIQKLNKTSENKVNAAKGVDKFIQPGDGGRKSLERYTISEKGIFYKQDDGSSFEVSTSPTDFTKLEAHIRNNAGDTKEFDKFKKEQEEKRDTRIEIQQKEIDELNKKKLFTPDITKEDIDKIDNNITIANAAIVRFDQEYDEAIEKYKIDNPTESNLAQMLDDFKDFVKEVDISKVKAVPLQESVVGGLRDMGLNEETLAYISMFRDSGLLIVEC